MRDPCIHNAKRLIDRGLAASCPADNGGDGRKERERAIVTAIDIAMFLISFDKLTGPPLIPTANYTCTFDQLHWICTSKRS